MAVNNETNNDDDNSLDCRNNMSCFDFSDNWQQEKQQYHPLCFYSYNNISGCHVRDVSVCAVSRYVNGAAVFWVDTSFGLRHRTPD
eukprot:scaffold1923_cov160-Amphora_coffeaeformis.AAC.15